MMAIETKFFGPTTAKGARVKATHPNSGKSVTVSWDHNHGETTNHENAAVALLLKLNIEFKKLHMGFLKNSNVFLVER